ncbi:transposase [Lysobacter koreensis]|uniref:Transposase n=1 Tax=Lysobacter koreensis TaxID=266122 RepID=A0ABW2YPX8_9GAMM
MTEAVLMTSGHIALRKGRHSSAGQIYLVTFTTADRQPHFAPWEVGADAAYWMTEPAQWGTSRLLAWVLMPDHWHGLIELGPGALLPALVQRLKGRTARLLGLAHPALGGIWAAGYHDHALRKEEDLLAAARYLVMNSVRAGLVRSAGRYPFWDAVRL